MVEIKIEEGERIEAAIRRFKRSVDRAGTIKEVRERSEYKKPSERRKIQEAAARSRSRSERRRQMI